MKDRVKSPLEYSTLHTSPQDKLIHSIYDAVVSTGPDGTWHIVCDENDPGVQEAARTLTREGYVLQTSALYQGFEVMWGHRAEGRESVIPDKPDVPWNKLVPLSYSEEEDLLWFLAGPDSSLEDISAHLDHYFSAVEMSGADADTCAYMLRTIAMIIANMRQEAYRAK